MHKTIQLAVQKSLARMFVLAIAAFLIGCVPFSSTVFAQDDVLSAEVEFLVDSPAKSGVPTKINRDEVQLSIEGNAEKFASSDLASLSFANPPKKFNDPIIVTLIDGSQIWTDDLTMVDDKWSLERDGDKLTVEPGSVSQILFRQPTQQELGDWQSITKANRSNDSLVISRSSGAVDQIDGLVAGVNEDSVEFDFDGQMISAPRNKLLGIVIYRRQPQRISPAPLVNLTDGSSIRAESLNFDTQTQQLKIGLLDDRQIMISAGSVSKIDFATANVRWLADVSVLDSRSLNAGLDLLSNTAEDEMQILSMGMAPVFVKPKDVRASYEPIDLRFRQPAIMEFRVPEGFSRFSCSVSRDVVGASVSPITIRLELAGKEIASEALPMTEDSIDISVGVEAEKRLRLIVECENSLPVGSSTIWKQPRFIR